MPPGMGKIRKLVLPVAGVGKRLRPLTLRTPKNLLSLDGKPLLAYALEEASRAGVKEVILVASPEHRKRFEKYLAAARRQFPDLRFTVRVQKEPIGNGHAILRAADLLKGEPFAVRFCDDVIVSRVPVLISLIRLFERCRAPVMLLKRVPKAKVSRYGVVRVKKVKEQSSLYEITDFVEKPPVAEAPSNLIVVGGYILTPAIIRNLSRLERAGTFTPERELWLTDAFRLEIARRGKLYGWEFPGKRLDCGTLEGFRKAELFFRQRKRQR